MWKIQTQRNNKKRNKKMPFAFAGIKIKRMPFEFVVGSASSVGTTEISNWIDLLHGNERNRQENTCQSFSSLSFIVWFLFLSLFFFRSFLHCTSYSFLSFFRRWRFSLCSFASSSLASTRLEKCLVCSPPLSSTNSRRTRICCYQRYRVACSVAMLCGPAEFGMNHCPRSVA